MKESLIFVLLCSMCYGIVEPKAATVLELKGGMVCIMPSAMSLHANEGARIAPATGGLDDSCLRVQITNGEGFVEVRGPFVAVEPQSKYKVTAEFGVKDLKLGTFVTLIVREYEQTDKRPKPEYNKTFPEWRAVQASRDGESIKRYAYVTTGSTTKFINASLIIKGNPSLVEIRRILVETNASENEKREEAAAPQQQLMPRKVMLDGLSNRPNAETKLVKSESRVNVTINGKTVVPVLTQGSYWRPEISLHKTFSDAGVVLQVVPVLLGPYRYEGTKLVPSVWQGAGKYDFAYMDASIERVLRVDPNAYVIVGLGLIPYQNWGQEHPDEVSCNEKGEKAVGSYVHNIAYRNELRNPAEEFYCPSLYSEVYKSQVLETVDAWFKHARKQPYYKAIVGVMMYGGDDGQWQNWARSGMLNMGDYSPAGKTAYRRWLRDKYVHLDALRAAWNDKAVDFNSAAIPSVQERVAAGQTFRDPVKDRRVIDYRQFECEEKSNTIVYFGKGIKERAGKGIIVGCYYEDAIYGRTGNYWAEHIRQSSPYLDFFACPLDYGAYRSPGYAGGVSSCWASLRMHNKLFVEELDLRTNVSRYSNDQYEKYVIGRLETAEDFDAVNRRETGLMNVLGMTQWYYQMAGGSFFSPYAAKGVKEAVAVYDQVIRRAKAFTPDVAVFADEDSEKYMSQSAVNQILFPSTSGVRPALYLSGVPFDLYSMHDLMDANMPDYKVYVFLNSYMLSHSQREFINKRLKRNGKTIVWVHAAGYLSENDKGIENVRLATGINIKLDPKVQDLESKAVRSSGVLTALNPYQNNIYLDEVAGPKFYIVDQNAVTLARYTADKKTSIAIKDMGTWTSVYIAQPGGLTPEMLNAIARKAGAYTAAGPGDMVALNGSMMVVHGVTGGQMKITLPFEAEVKDLLSGKVISGKTKQFELNVPIKETVLLDLTETQQVGMADSGVQR